MEEKQEMIELHQEDADHEYRDLLKLQVKFQSLFLNLIKLNPSYRVIEYNLSHG